jgi:hypothetical protein
MSAPWGDRTWPYFLATLKAKGVDHEVVDPAVIPWLAPSQHARPLGAVRIPDGRMDPGQVLRALERALVSIGVQMIDDSAVWVEQGSPLRVHTADGTVIPTGRVVLANGSFAQALIDQIPALRFETPRLVWGNGSALDLTFPEWVPENDPNNPLWRMDCVIRSLNPIGACGLHVVPRGEGRFYDPLRSRMGPARAFDRLPAERRCSRDQPEVRVVHRQAHRQWFPARHGRRPSAPGRIQCAGNLAAQRDEEGRIDVRSLPGARALPRDERACIGFARCVPPNADAHSL